MSRVIFRSIPEAHGAFGPCALAIGNFDGVHIGHQALLADAARFGSKDAFFPAALTFDPHPTVVVAPDRTPPFICTLDQRLHFLEIAGMTRIMVLHITAEIARLSPEEFVRQILVDLLDTRAVFVGGNFRFGHKQAGTPDTLRELGKRFGFVSQIVQPVSYRGEIVSSSAIRNCLSEGKVSRAGRLLGRCFSVEGPVVPGRGIGRTKAVPTLNLHPPPDQIVPRGIYITETLEASTGLRWQSVTSVGTNPTFGETSVTIETFLLAPAFDGKTPQRIQVFFRRFIRPERRFDTPEALKAEIKHDVSRAQAYWRRVATLKASIY